MFWSRSILLRSYFVWWYQFILRLEFICLLVSLQFSPFFWFLGVYLLLASLSLIPSLGLDSFLFSFVLLEQRRCHWFTIHNGGNWTGIGNKGKGIAQTSDMLVEMEPWREVLREKTGRKCVRFILWMHYLLCLDIYLLKFCLGAWFSNTTEYFLSLCYYILLIFLIICLSLLIQLLIYHMQQKPSFELSGKLAAETNRVRGNSHES